MEHLGAVLEARRAEHPRPVAALRLLTLTGVRLSEVLELRWDEIGELSGEGASARLDDDALQGAAAQAATVIARATGFRAKHPPLSIETATVVSNPRASPGFEVSHRRLDRTERKDPLEVFY